MSTMTRFDQLGALLSEDCYSPTRMANRGFTITGEPAVWVSARGKNLTYFNGTDEKATWVGQIGTIKTISFWFICKSNNEQFFDFDGGTHTIDSAVGVIRANGWTTPTIYVDGAATGNYSLNVLHHCLITSATGFDASSFKIGTDGGVNYGAVAIADVVLLPNNVSAAEALLIAKDKLFRYDESLVSDWDFSTTNPRDRKGTNHGTGTNIAAADIVDGLHGSKAIDFDGATEFVTTSVIPASVGGDYSLVAEFILDGGAGTNRGLIGYTNTSLDAFTIIDATNLFYARYFAVGSVFTTTGPTIGVPTFVSYTIRSSDSKHVVRSSIDGFVEHSAAIDLVTYPIVPVAVLIGKRGSVAQYFPGRIFCSRFYARDLLPLQCQDLYSRIRQGR